jgi:hypothetical protein
MTLRAAHAPDQPADRTDHVVIAALVRRLTQPPLDHRPVIPGTITRRRWHRPQGSESARGEHPIRPARHRTSPQPTRTAINRTRDLFGADEVVTTTLGMSIKA